MAEIHIRNIHPMRKNHYARECSKRGVKLGELVQRLLDKELGNPDLNGIPEERK